METRRSGTTLSVNHWSQIKHGNVNGHRCIRDTREVQLMVRIFVSRQRSHCLRFDLPKAHHLLSTIFPPSAICRFAASNSPDRLTANEWAFTLHHLLPITLKVYFPINGSLPFFLEILRDFSTAHMHLEMSGLDRSTGGRHKQPSLLRQDGTSHSGRVNDDRLQIVSSLPRLSIAIIRLGDLCRIRPFCIILSYRGR